MAAGETPMSAASETEIKLLASPAMLASLRTHPRLAGVGDGAESTGLLVTTYFDAVDHRLQRAGISLRTRCRGRDREQTVKCASLAGGAVRRGEWTSALAGDEPVVRDLPAPARALVGQVLGRAKLRPIATTRIERTVRRLVVGGSLVEIAFDTGRLEVGDRSEPVCELELELLDGSLHDVVALVLELPVGPGLRWSIRSKSRRCNMLGDRLASDAQPCAPAAQAPSLLPGMDVATGFQAIAWSCLDHLLTNTQLVIETGEPEAVHQCRVAIRRFRAACKLFRDVLVDDEAQVIAAGVKAAGRVLGQVRDLDVLHHRLAGQIAGNRPHRLSAQVEKVRADAIREAQATLASAGFQRLLFQIARWIEAGEWRRAGAETGSDRPLLPFARHILSKARHKLHPKAAALHRMSDPALHRLRIRAKTLRYAMEFFAPLWTDAPAPDIQGKSLHSLKGVQDALGELHDLAVAAGNRAALLDGLDPIDAAEMAVEFELIQPPRAKTHGKLVKSAEKSLSRALRIPGWWTLD
jgi:inorganic triphosphatase YgiF